MIVDRTGRPFSHQGILDIHGSLHGNIKAGLLEETRGKTVKNRNIGILREGIYFRKNLWSGVYG